MSVTPEQAYLLQEILLALPRGNQGASNQRGQGSVLCTAAPLNCTCTVHLGLPSFTFNMDTQDWEWKICALSLCSNNVSSEQWHHDRKEKGKWLRVKQTRLAQEGMAGTGDKIILISPLFPSPVTASGPSFSHPASAMPLFSKLSLYMRVVRDRLDKAILGTARQARMTAITKQ